MDDEGEVDCTEENILQFDSFIIHKQVGSYFVG
jgi:hypothetical protein